MNHPELARHQVELVRAVNEDWPTKYMVLSAPLGMGKTTATVIAIGDFMLANPQAHVLIVASSKLLAEQFVGSLSQNGVDATSVDVYQVRKLLDEGHGRLLWPRGSATVVTAALLQQLVGRAHIADTPWDLVVVDDADHVILDEDIVAALESSSKRIFLMTTRGAELSGASSSFAEAFDEARTTTWDWSDATRSGFVRRPVQLRVTDYCLTAEELDFSNAVAALAGCCPNEIEPTELFAMRQLQLLMESSPVAAEGLIRRRLARLRDSQAAAGSAAAEPCLDPEGYVEALRLMDEMRTDSKLNTLGGLLDRVRAEQPMSRLVIFTEFAATLFYIAEEMDERAEAYRTVEGSTPLVEREAAFSWFLQEGGILLTTLAGLAGAEFPTTTDLILYDIPAKRAQYEMFERFASIGVHSPLTVHALISDRDTDASSRLEHLRASFDAMRVQSQ